MRDAILPVGFCEKGKEGQLPLFRVTPGVNEESFWVFLFLLVSVTRCLERGWGGFFCKFFSGDRVSDLVLVSRVGTIEGRASGLWLFFWL